MEARTDSEIIDIGENGRLRVQIALTDRPWSIPADTLVLPASSSKDLGELGHSFRAACGPQWFKVSAAIDGALKDRKLVEVVEPLLVKLPRLETNAPNLANLILVSIRIPDFSRWDMVVGQIMELANHHEIERLILPVVGGGVYGESPVEAAQSAFKAVMTAKNRSLRAVIFVTLFDEARQWLLNQAPVAAEKFPAATSPRFTASARLRKELASIDKMPTPLLQEIFVTAGRLAGQRRKDKNELTTSLILFAAVWLGSTSGHDAERAFLKVFADEVHKRGGKGYDSLLAEYFSSPPKFDGLGEEPVIAASSQNTSAVLRNAAKLVARTSPTNMVGAEAYILALLDNQKANANNNLERIGVDVTALREKLQTYTRSEAPAGDRPSKKPARKSKSRPAPPAELAAGCVVRINTTCKVGRDCQGGWIWLRQLILSLSIFTRLSGFVSSWP